MELDVKIAQSDAMKLLDLSQAQISRLIRDKWIQTDSRGKMTPRGVFKGYIQSIKRGVAKSDADLKAARLRDYEQRTEARGDKFRKAAEKEALDFNMRVWPEVTALLDSIPALATRDQDERTRIRNVIDDFRRKFVVKLKASCGAR
jgi:hypothetical protein